VNGIHTGHDRAGQPGSFPAKQQRVPRLVIDFRVALPVTSLYGKNPRWFYGLKTRRQRWILENSRHLVIVQASALNLSIAQIKPQGVNEMQTRPRIGAQTDYIPSVGGDLRFEKNDVKHTSILIETAIICP